MWLPPLYITKMENCFKWNMKKSLLTASDLSTLSLMPQTHGMLGLSTARWTIAKKEECLFVSGSILWTWILTDEPMEYKELTVSIVCCITGVQSGILQMSPLTTKSCRAAENSGVLLPLMYLWIQEAPFNIQIIISSIIFCTFQVSLDINSYSDYNLNLTTS